jgi:hypothetical protein
VNWEILGELEPSYYTSISKALFTVSKNIPATAIIDSILDLFPGATSIPINIKLTNPPDVAVTITLSNPDGVDGITLTPSELQFTANEIEHSFIIKIDTDVVITASTINFVISGPNKNSFVLGSPTLTFNIRPHTVGTPTIVSVSPTQIQRVS